MGFDALDADTATGLAREVNDELAAAIRARPTRLGGFATLALKDLKEPQRNWSAALPTSDFEELWSTALRRDSSSTIPDFSPSLKPRHISRCPFISTPRLRRNQFARPIFPACRERRGCCCRLQGGEGLPYALARSSSVLSRAAPQLHQPVANYFQSNIHTSGYFTLPPLRCALDVVGIDRLMFSVDYPFSANTTGRKFLDEAIPALGSANAEKLVYANAEHLLNMRETAPKTNEARW